MRPKTWVCVTHNKTWHLAKNNDNTVNMNMPMYLSVTGTALSRNVHHLLSGHTKCGTPAPWSGARRSQGWAPLRAPPGRASEAPASWGLSGPVGSPDPAALGHPAAGGRRALLPTSPSSESEPAFPVRNQTAGAAAVEATASLLGAAGRPVRSGCVPGELCLRAGGAGAGPACPVHACGACSVRQNHERGRRVTLLHQTSRISLWIGGVCFLRDAGHLNPPVS